MIVQTAKDYERLREWWMAEKQANPAPFGLKGKSFAGGLICSVEGCYGISSAQSEIEAGLDILLCNKHWIFFADTVFDIEWLFQYGLALDLRRGICAVCEGESPYDDYLCDDCREGEASCNS